MRWPVVDSFFSYHVSSRQVKYVTRYEKKGQLTEKHVIRDGRKGIPGHAHVLCVTAANNY